MERLDKFLCNCGIATRSAIKGILKAGRVTVDGKTEKDGARKIGPENKILLDGEPVNAVGTVVLMLNKPAGFVTATEDKQERTVMELIPDKYRRLDVKPVGRLDKATEGLLLFTNDGELLHKLISPGKGVEKVYYARHEGCAGQEDVEAFAAGLTLGDGTVCRSAVLKPLGAGESMVHVCDGKYHQVRRMLASRGMPVTYLERVREGGLTLGDLPRGQVRELTDEELDFLHKGFV
jgi:16S rRNA pseudouridine516 synthase